MLGRRVDAYDLLKRLGAPARLLTHVQLVGDAADALVAKYDVLGVPFDRQLTELGVAVHDAGKILHPEELDGPGSQHEPAGRELMLQNGVQPDVAQCCVSHAAWATPGLGLEELSVALADKLWKGKRETELEMLVIDKIAEKLGVQRWDVFTDLDSAFEDIAAGGDERLERSRR